MKICEIKNLALSYAKQFQESDDIELNLDENLNNAEWYIVLQLAQIYYNALTNKITKKKAAEQQNLVFDYVKNNYSLFA